MSCTLDVGLRAFSDLQMEIYSRPMLGTRRECRMEVCLLWVHCLRFFGKLAVKENFSTNEVSLFQRPEACMIPTPVTKSLLKRES